MSFFYCRLDKSRLPSIRDICWFMRSFHDFLHSVETICIRQLFCWGVHGSRYRVCEKGFYSAMKGFTTFSFYIFLVVNSETALGNLPKEDHHTFEVWNDGNVRKRSESSSSSSFHVKVEQYEQKTDEKGTHEVTKVRERNKPAGGNETSSSKTIEMIRYPNGTTRRKVINNGPAMEVSFVNVHTWGFLLFECLNRII